MKQGPLSNICGFLESDCNLNSKDMPPFYVKSFSLHKLNHFLMKTPQKNLIKAKAYQNFVHRNSLNESFLSKYQVRYTNFELKNFQNNGNNFNCTLFSINEYH